MTKDTLVTCRGVRCDRTAVALCPGCGIPLCCACLARHAQFPSKAIREKHNEKASGKHD